jgi:hypothetical protein
MPTMIRHALPALLIVIAAGCADAAQSLTGSEIDGRFAFGTSPGPRKHDVAGGATTDVDRSYGTHFESGLFWSSGGLAGTGLGLVAGPSVFYRSTTANDAGGGSETRFNAFGLKVAGGPAYRWSDLRFELTPFIGFGWAKTRIDGPGSSMDSDRGLMTDYGIALATSIDLTTEAFMGVQVGFDAFRAKVTFPGAGAGGKDLDDTVTGSGLLLVGFFGGRF